MVKTEIEFDKNGEQNEKNLAERSQLLMTKEESPGKKICKVLIRLFDGKYRCEICNEVFDKRKRYHYLKHANNSRLYKCDICGKSFIFEWNLSSHVKWKHEPKEFHKCDICNKSVRNIRAHKKLHIDNFPFKCEPCKKAFRLNCLLIMHNNVYHNNIRHTCSLCGRSYPTIGSLNDHINIAHNPDYVMRTFMCDVCTEVVPTRYRAKHMEKHTGYTCDVCGKFVTSKNSLENHLLTHNGEKPLKCEICGNSFRKSYTLKCHMNIHKGIKPYSCLECGKCFRQSSSLKIHSRMHTGEKPYSCTLCSDAFVCKSLLNLHHKNKHGIQI